MNATIIKKTSYSEYCKIKQKSHIIDSRYYAVHFGTIICTATFKGRPEHSKCVRCLAQIEELLQDDVMTLICFTNHWLFYEEKPSTTGRFPSQKASALRWRHNDHDGVSNHQPHGCSLNRLFRRRSKKTSKLRVTGLCVGNSPRPVNSPHKGPVTRKMFPFDDVIIG